MKRLRAIRVTPLSAALLIVLLVALGAGIGTLAERNKGAEFQVDTNVLVRFWSIEGYLLTGQASPVDSLDVADVATLASGLDVLDAAAKTLDDGRTGADLTRSVTVSPLTTANAISISATAGSPTQATVTAKAVASALITSVNDQVNEAATKLAGSTGGSAALSDLRQRAAALTSTVEPLEALAPAEATQTSPNGKTPVAMAVVGLAAAALIIVGLVFGRPLVGSAREAQRLLEVPAVPFGGAAGAAAARMLRRLLDDRPVGTLLIVPVDEAAGKDADAFVDWARAHSIDPREAERLELAPDPGALVLRRRPTVEHVAAVLLFAPAGTRRRDLADAAHLLRAWRAPDAVVLAVGRHRENSAAPAAGRAAQPSVLAARQN